MGCPVAVEPVEVTFGATVLAGAVKTLELAALKLDTGVPTLAVLVALT
jgi:hypothetical protein